MTPRTTNAKPTPDHSKRRGLPTYPHVRARRGARKCAMGGRPRRGALRIGHRVLELPGARRLVSSIPVDRWAIATSASRRLGSARWIGAGIPVPRVVIAAEDVPLGKPDPQPYLAAAHELGFDIADCLIVEDSPGGGQAGLAAGAQVLAVGSQVWSRQPACRVPDLGGVACTVTEDGLLSISVATI